MKKYKSEVEGDSPWAKDLRILKAWQFGAQNNLIADAAVMDNRLFVLDCALKRYEIKFDQLKALAKIPRNARSKFIISEEGGHITWPDYDVDLDLDSLRVVLDPDLAEKAAARKLAHDRQFGAAIACLRNERKLRQGDIIGLTDRQVRRIESGDQHAGLKSLQLIAKAHDLQLKQYLSRVAKCIGELRGS